ncbi:MAG: class I SAM-dependent methyltransferase [Deltaproteobacteria bacterium]|nr:class I SAM-dependent methyltransferase [Deltaproteobacteria bacterium]
MAGPLGDGLEPVMTALPWYPHRPWPETAPDFFQILEEVDFAGRRVIAIGAGRTWSSRFLATIGRAAEVVAVDVLTRRYLGLETADLFFAADRSFFERLCADAHRLPLADGWADAVFSVASIHHSSDLDGLFAEIARVLRPGGVLVFVSEPGRSGRSASRRFCSSRETNIAHLTIVVPESTSSFSKALISS